MAKNEGENLDEIGLICHSYDSLFLIRKRLRKINDITIPMKRGLPTNQLGIFLLVFLLSLITFGLVVNPLISLLSIPKPWVIALLWLFGPPLLAAQRIAKPMADGKTIGGAWRSWLRFHLDDRVHRRGLPVPAPKQPSEESVPHWQREWVPAFSDDPADRLPEVVEYSDEKTEERFSDNVVDLQSWMDGRSRQHHNAEVKAKTEQAKKEEKATHFRRGAPQRVRGPEPDDDTTTRGA